MEQEELLMVVLTDGRLTLKPPNAEDIPAITAACQDPEIPRWTTVPANYRREHAEQFVEEYADKGWAAWAELSKDSDQQFIWAIHDKHSLIGAISVSPRGGSAGEIGYWLAASARGQGLTAQAGQLVLNWVFDDPAGPQLTWVIWKAIVGNWPSLRTAWKLGFTLEGQIRGSLLHAGQRHDEWIGTIHRDDPRAPATSWPVQNIPVMQP